MIQVVFVSKQYPYLEECKSLGVGRFDILDRVQKVNSNMAVANDLALSVQLLRGSKIVLVGVHKVAGLHPPYGHGDGKRCRSPHNTKVRREGEFLRYIDEYCELSKRGENLTEVGILSMLGIMPMGMGLHDPVLTCLPSVRGRLGTVRQKLIKLLREVKEETWPALGTS